MKIAIFTDSYFPQINGVSFVVRNHAKSLIERGHEVEIFAPMSDEDCEVDKEIPTHRFKSIKFAPYPDYDIAFPWIPKVTKYISRGDFNIVHCHTPFTMGLTGMYIAKRLNAGKAISSKLNKIRKKLYEPKKITLIGTFHTVISDFGHILKPVPERLTGKAAEKFGTKFYNRMHSIITPSHHTKMLLEGFGVKRPINVLSNGIDLGLFKPDVGGAEVIRERYGINDKPLVLHVGRISKERNVEEFVRAAPLILREIPDARFLVVGGGPHLEYLKELAVKLNLGDYFKFTGRAPQEDLIAAYTTADVFVTASTIDTQGLVVLESLACGTPVVAANAKALPEIAVENETGLLFEPGDIAGLAAQVVKMLRDQEMREKMSENGLNLVKSHSLEKSVDRLVEIYESAVEDNMR